MNELQLLTSKKVFYVANVDEKQLADAEAGKDPLVEQLRAHAKKENAPVVVICAAAEAEIATLEPAERRDFLESLGLTEPGLNKVVRTGYDLLGLITFFTAGRDRGPRLDHQEAARRRRRPRASSTPTSRRASSRPRSSGGRTSSSSAPRPPAARPRSSRSRARST